MSNSKIEYFPEGSYVYNFANMKRYGPGLWYSFMLDASNAESRDELLHTCKRIRTFCKRAKCQVCHGHCTEYVKNNPPEYFAQTNESLFYYIVDFMNAVYTRTDRPICSKEILYGIFFNNTDVVVDTTVTTPISYQVSNTSHLQIPRKDVKTSNIVPTPYIPTSSFNSKEATKDIKTTPCVNCGTEITEKTSTYKTPVSIGSGSYGRMSTQYSRNNSRSNRRGTLLYNQSTRI